MSSIYLSKFSGHCSLCGTRIDTGVEVVKRKKGGMVHSRCVGLSVKSDIQRKRDLVQFQRRRRMLRTSAAQDIPNTQPPTPVKTGSKRSRLVPENASTPAQVVVRLEVHKSDLPDTITRLVVETPCGVCGVPKGVKCVGSRMKWVHKGRVNLFIERNRKLTEEG